MSNDTNAQQNIFSRKQTCSYVNTSNIHFVPTTGREQALEVMDPHVSLIFPMGLSSEALLLLPETLHTKEQ